MVGVGDEGVQSLTAGHSGGDRFQLVPTQIQLLQYLQFTEFAENRTKGDLYRYNHRSFLNDVDGSILVQGVSEV